MSVKIYYEDGSMKDYREDAPVAEQLIGSNYVNITVAEDNGKIATSFLQNLANQHFLEILSPVDLRVEKGDMIVGAKVTKQARALSKKIAIYWLAKEMAKLQSKIDSELGDIVKNIRERIL